MSRWNRDLADQAGRGPLTGPLSNRPKARRDATRPGERTFHDVLADLAATRSRYERLRSTDGRFDERARLVSSLHDLRAEIAAVRLRSRF